MSATVRVAILLAVGACAVWFAADARAHLVTRPKAETRAAIHASQTKNLAHARYVCRHGGRAHKRWSCKAVVWLEREWRETLPLKVGHLSLWLCIHRGEASWSNPGIDWRGRRSVYYGGLQMTYKWLGLIPGYAHHLSPSEQMRAAERGYRLSGYSRAWLFQQWPTTGPRCARYA